MKTRHQTGAPSGAVRGSGGACILRRWRGACVLAAATALAGCAGMGGIASLPTTVPPQPPVSSAGAQAAVAPNPAAPFTAAVALTRPSPLRLGDAIAFILSTSTAGYGHLYMINASGNVVALVENLPVAPHAPVLFPAPDAGFTVRASPPAGTDRVLFLVTLQPFQGFGGAAGAPVTLALQADAFVAALNAATARLGGGGWALAEIRVEVLAAGGGGVRDAAQPGDGRRAHNVSISSFHGLHRGRSA